MWPVLLNMTRDDCRRTLRRLELEAYSNMISVFRAQGTLEEGRRKLLGELREALHIGRDRHSAEARRAANDEMLATIAEKISGANTGLGWTSEGRRRVPLMPRGIAQTAYRELADKVALQVTAENEKLKRRLDAERLVAYTSAEDANMEEDAASETEEYVLQANVHLNDEALCPSIVMEDQSVKILEMEALGRKRKVAETSAVPEDVATTPVINISHSTNQKHLNLSQIYSNFPKTPGESSGHSKHSYNQVSKLSSQQTPGSTNKRRKKNLVDRTKPVKRSKSSLHTPVSSKSYSLNPMSLHVDLSEPPSSSQASYAQSGLSLKTYGEDIETDQQNLLSDSPTMRLPTQPASTPHNLGFAQPEDSSALHGQSTPIKQAPVITGKPCQLIIKKNSNIMLDKPNSSRKLQMPGIKIFKKSSEAIKVLPKKQVIVAPSSAQNALNMTGKVIHGKLLHNVPRKTPTGLNLQKVVVVSGNQQHLQKSVANSKNIIISSTNITTPISKSTVTVNSNNMPTGLNSSNLKKVVVVSGNQQHLQKSVANSKNIIISSTNITTPISKGTVTVNSNNIAPKIAEDSTPKSIAANDVQVPTRPFFLNPKSGQKMVFLPAKARGKTNIDGQTKPLLHIKGVPTTMKLLPVSSSLSHSGNLTIVSRPSVTNVVTPTKTKIIGVEGVKTSRFEDDSSKPKFQGLQLGTKVMGTPVIHQPIKGSVIVVQKGTPLGKNLSFSINNNEMSKIVMGKNFNKLMQAQSRGSSQDSSKKPGNMIVLDLNDQLGPTTMSEILDSHTTKAIQTEDTPVLFDRQIAEETSNANSIESIISVDMKHLEEGTISSMEKENESKSVKQENKSSKDNSSVTDWEMELDTVSAKRKENDSGSLHIDNEELCISSDSEMDVFLVKKEKLKSQAGKHEATEESTSLFGERGGLSRASRMLFSQLQDEGSSSNDSSFALNKSILDKRLEKGAPSTGEDGSKALVKSDTVKSTSKHMDMYGAADMQLGPFGYLESDESMMVGEDMFGVGAVEESKASRAKNANLELQLSELLSETPETNN